MTRPGSFDVEGRFLCTLVDEPLAPGAYAQTIDTDFFHSGVYFLVLTTPTDPISVALRAP